MKFPLMSRKKYEKEIKMLLNAFQDESDRLQNLTKLLSREHDKERVITMDAAEYQTRILKNWIADCFYGGFLWHVNEDSPRVVDYNKGKGIEFYKGPSQID